MTTHVVQLLMMLNKGISVTIPYLKKRTAYLCGMVDLKMSSMQRHVWSQALIVNLLPFDITKFSRQLVPDLEKRYFHFKVRV